MAGKDDPIVISTSETDTDSSVIFSNNKYFVARKQKSKFTNLQTDSSANSRNSDETIKVVAETG